MTYQRIDEPQSVSGAQAIGHYDQLKFEIAKVAQAAMQFCRELGDQELAVRYQSVLARLAEDRFNLAVVGQFSRGKSTLINALLGIDRVPTGVLPHTSVITTISYGEKERILIRSTDSSFPQEIELRDLARYVTESGNPGNRRRVASADIQLPIDALLHGLVFIDTPGVGSAIVENTLTTMQFLPEIDAAVFVTAFDSPLSEYELELLRETLRRIGKVFVVVNKVDLVSSEERVEVLRHVSERLALESPETQLEIFGVSGRSAVRGKLACDYTIVDCSGLPDLEAAIWRFLDTEKVPQLCRRTVDRLRSLLETQHVEFAVASERGASGYSREQIRNEYYDFQMRRNNLAREAVAELRKELPRVLCPLLQPVFSELENEAIKEFERKVLRGSTVFEVPRLREIVNDTSSYFANRLGAWLAGSVPTLAQLVRASAGAAINELESLPLAAWSGVVGSKADTVTNNEERVRATLSAPKVQKVEWAGRSPWAIYLVPMQWAGSAISGWFAVAIAELLTEYRAQTSRTLLSAAEDFVNEIGIQVESQIDQCADRMMRTVTTDLLDDHTTRLKELLSQLETVRMNLLNPGRFSRDEYSDSASSQIGKRDQTASLSSANCPICTTSSQVVFDHLAKRQYDLTVDEKLRAQHLGAGGFCAFHTWAYASLASPQSVCHTYPELLIARQQQLEEAATLSQSSEELCMAVRQALAHSAQCAVCRLVSRTEREAARDVVSTLSQSDGQAPALCIPHLYIAVNEASDIEHARRLVVATAGALRMYADAMKRFALKFDAVRRGLLTSTERKAHSAGLSKLVADSRLAMTPSSDREI